MSNEAISRDARTFVRSFREGYAAHRMAAGRGRRAAGGAPAVPSARTTRGREGTLDERALPEAVRALVDEYRAAHPGRPIRWEKHMRTVDGQPVVVVDDGQELPADDDFVSVSFTATLAAADAARVVTDVVVGRLDGAGGEGGVER